MQGACDHVAPMIKIVIGASGYAHTLHIAALTESLSRFVCSPALSRYQFPATPFGHRMELTEHHTPPFLDINLVD